MRRAVGGAVRADARGHLVYGFVTESKLASSQFGQEEDDVGVAFAGAEAVLAEAVLAWAHLRWRAAR